MATDLERLVVSLEASTAKYERALNKAMGVTNAKLRGMETRAKSAGLNVGAALARGFAVIGGAAVLRGAQQLIDASTRIENSLKVAGLAGEELGRVYDRLFQSAQRNAAPVESLVQLYGRASLVQKELGISTEELLGFTDRVAVALRVSGQSAAESSGALLQLAQALGSGIVRAEEFNSILEGALPIAQAAAAGLKEAGGSVAKLRQLVVDGKVSSEAFFRAFEAGSVTLEKKVSSSELTIGQSFQKLSNALVDAAGDFDEATGASSKFANAMNVVANAVAGIDFSALSGQIGQLRRDFETAASDFGNNDFFKWLEGTLVAPEKRLQPPQRSAPIDADPNDPRNFLALPEQSVLPTGPQGRGGRRNVQTISLDDYTVDGKSGSGSRRSPAERFDDALAAQARRTEQLRQETALQAGLNPLVSDYGYAIERLRVQHDLENEATKAGLDLTPDRQKAIENLALGYAQATVEAERLAEAQAMARDSMLEWFDLGRTASRGFIDDLMKGKSAAEALGNVFDQLGSKLIDMGLSSLFGTGQGANAFGLLGQVLGIPGRAGGGRVSAGRPYIVGEERPELFVPDQSGTIVPRVPAIAAAGVGAATQITYAPQIDARGADMAAVARLEQVIARDRVEFEGRVRQIVSRRSKMGW